MASAVTFNIDGLNNLQSALTRKSKPFVKIGVVDSKDNRHPVYPTDKGDTNSTIARKHEFGIGVPERSILRKPMMTVMSKRLNNVPRDILNNNLSNGIDSLLEAIGQEGVDLVDDNFKQQGIPTGWRPLSDGTLENRKRHNRSSTKILIDSGQLESSFGYEVVS